MKTKKSSKKSVHGFLPFIGAGVLVCGLIIGLSHFFSSSVPKFFPFNQSSAEYTILKDSPESPYMVGYKGPGACCVGVNQNGYIAIIVGSTTYDLSQFVGKKVLISKGKFISSNTQCIADSCTKLAGPYAVVNIDDMKIVEGATR